MDPDCIFCKIIHGEIPSHKILETEKSFAFMDISPLSEGHCLFIPKEHKAKLHELEDESMEDILQNIKKVASALALENYNVLQNNGRMAHQAVFHVHFHLIPKPNPDEGLGIIWNTKDNSTQESIAKQVREKLSA